MSFTTKVITPTIKALGNRKFRFQITTGSLDRDNDRIDPLGVQLTAYLKNPVVLWAHQNSIPPVGRASDIRVTSDGISAVVEFAQTELANNVHDLVKDGFLRAASIGFRPIESARNNEGGLDFSKVELHEFSVVPVGSNSEALVQLARKAASSYKGIDKTLDHLSPKALRLLIRKLVRESL